MELTVSFSDSDVVLAIQVSPDMSIEDLTAYILEESGFPPGVVLFRGTQRLASGSLAGNGVADHDMIVVVRGPTGGPTGGSSGGGALGGPIGGPESSGEIEELRQSLLYDPVKFGEISSSLPALAQALHDPEQFRAAYEQMRRMHAQMLEGVGGEEIQRRLLASGQTDEINANLRLAMEEMPEVFASVSMLFIDMSVNGIEAKAMVDSGAQSTIISEELAQRVGIHHLIDRRVQGEAVGIGRSKMVGRIYMVPVKLGSSFFPCSFLVLGSLPVDILLGLDMLKHHQASIDLRRNALVMGDEVVPFLGESEIPALNGLPGSVEAQSGQTNQSNKPGQSGQSGQANPPSQTQNRPSQPSQGSQPGQSNQGLQVPQQRPRRQTNPFTRAHEQQNQQAQQTQQTQPQQTQPQQTQHSQPQNQPDKYSAETISSLTNLGFSREEAVSALDKANGNVEMAGAILFG